MAEEVRVGLRGFIAGEIENAGVDGVDSDAGLLARCEAGEFDRHTQFGRGLDFFRRVERDFEGAAVAIDG